MLDVHFEHCQAFWLKEIMVKELVVLIIRLSMMNGLCSSHVGNSLTIVMTSDQQVHVCSQLKTDSIS